MTIPSKFLQAKSNTLILMYETAHETIGIYGHVACYFFD